MSVQWVAVASQKFTCPGVTGLLPAVTVAVSVTTLPDVTVVTELPPEVTARVVVVVASAAQACCAPPQRPIHTAAEINNWLGILAFKDELLSVRVWAPLVRRFE